MDNKIQTGLRIQEQRYKKIKENADRTGVSVNQYILMLIDIGLTYLDMEQAQARRIELHNPKDKF